MDELISYDTSTDKHLIISWTIGKSASNEINNYLQQIPASLHPSSSSDCIDTIDTDDPLINDE